MNRLWVAAAVVAANAAVAVVVALGLTFYAVGAVLATLVAVVVFQRPQRGLLLLAAGLPFDGLRIPFGLPEWTSNWVEGMVLLTLVAALVARPGLARPDLGRAWPGWAPGLIGLVLLGVASLRMVDAFQVLVGLKVTFQAVTMAFVAWRCPLSRRERDGLVTILMAVGAICATWGIIQQALGPEVMRDWGYRYNSTIRFSGSFMRSFSTFVQPFPFAFFLMIVVLVGIPIALNDPLRLRNRLFLFMLPVYGIGMLVAVVRGAWIGTAVGLLYLGVRRHRILLLGIPLAVIVLLLGPSTSGSNATKTTSGQTRLAAWNDNFYAIGDNPLGVGIGSAGAAAGKINVLEGGDRGYQFSGIDGDTAFQPDNQYFLYALDLGLAALWFYLLVLFAAFKSASRTSDRTSGDDSAFALGTGGVVVAYAVAGLVATILEILPVYHFWLLIGVTSTLAPDRKRGRVPAIALRPLPPRRQSSRDRGREPEPQRA
jgi:hypothetical protein